MQVTADALLDGMRLLISDCGEENKKLVSDVINIYTASDKTLDSSDTDLIQFYIRILRSMMSDSGIREGKEDAFRLIMLKFKSDKSYAKHREVADDLSELFRNRESQTAEDIMTIKSGLRNIVMWHALNKSFRRNFGQLSKVMDLTDPDLQRTEMERIKSDVETVTELFSSNAETTEESGKLIDALDCISMHDADSIAAGLAKHNARNIGSVLRTGLQGLNRALGKAHGFVGGESVVFNALPHQYKSGLLVSCAIWATTCNPDVNTDKGRPCIAFFSVENEAYQNMVWVFKKLYAKENGKMPSGMSDEDIVKWTVEYFAKFRTVLVIERHLPHNFGFRELIGRVNFYKAQGLDVRAVIVDYANLMNKGASSGAAAASRDVAVKELFSKLCNYFKNVGITFITAHPLNRKAAMLVSEGKTDVVKRFNTDHLADSMDVEREVDVSIYVHLETNHAGQKYLTAYLRKHRYVDDTPESHKYFAYKFQEDGLGIIDDIDGPPGYVTDIYAVELDNTMDGGELVAADGLF